MSVCERVRELMLEAEPDELRGSGDGEVARHVRGCATCARAARDVLRANEALDRVLGATSGMDAAAVALRALGAAATDELAARRRRRAGRWAGAGALAAAAVLAAVMWTGSPEPPAGPAPRIALGPPPLIEGESAANVAVIQTDDPDITVLWFF